MAKTIVFTRQFDWMDCGPACILRSLSHLTREGVSVAGIRDALNQIGADSASFEMTMEQLHDKCPLPAILVHRIRVGRFSYDYQCLY